MAWFPVPASSLVEVTVQRGVESTDRYNATRLDFAAPAVATHFGYVQERTLAESTTDGQTVAVDATAWLPFDTDIESTDRVLVGEDVWRVVVVKRMSFGSFRHAEVGLVREVTA